MAENINHRLILTNRELLELTGVDSVENFHSREIVLSTAMGDLILLGENLHVGKLDLEAKQMSVTGRIDSIQYRKSSAERKPSARGKNLANKLFK